MTSRALPIGRLLDMAFGAAVMGTVGTLIGLIIGGGTQPIAAGFGVVLGTVVGWLGGRRFLISILVGTAAGGLLAWAVAGFDMISIGAGAGAALGGFLGIWISMLLDMRADHRAGAPQEEPKA